MNPAVSTSKMKSSHFQKLFITNGFVLIVFVSFIAGNNVNERPGFDDNGYPIGLPIEESTPVGTKIFTLKGHGPGDTEIKYGIQKTDKFIVNPKSGVITLAKPLDREGNDTINFLVSLEAQTASGQSPNIVNIDAYVIVIDVNDNPPKFLNSTYETIIAEDAAIGTTVLPGIRVTDPDLIGKSIQLSCINLPKFPDACDKFHIIDMENTENTYVGALILNGTIDYKKQPFYEFLLFANDGQNNVTAKVVIKVSDVQNEPPEFLNSLTEIVYENVPINSLIMTIKARDGDQENPRNISYELVHNPSNYFLLDSKTGELRTAKPLDREALENKNGILTMIVKAREIIDGVLGNNNTTVSTATIVLRIKDINDEPPTFNRREYTVEIPENVRNGMPLPHLDMTVTDPDLDSGAEFSLRLEDVSGAFKVEPGSGSGSTSVTIRVANGSLDYENPNQRKFILLVVAEEKFTKDKFASTASVTVIVTDVNDNAPSFNKPSYTATVSETAEPNSIITSIEATDRDSGRFGTEGIIYELLGKGADHFVIDKKHGIITVAPCLSPGTSPCLDFEEQNEYFLNYKATDDNGDGQSTTVSLRISLADTNDSPPKFLQEKYRAVIDEGSIKFEPALFVEARDRDKTSKITYSIINGNDLEFFRIDSNSGEIQINLDNGPINLINSTQNFIELKIQATDGVFFDDTKVNITVRDINNNPPVFLHDFYGVNVPETAQPGFIVEELTATDADDGLNAEITYRIQKGAIDDFIINETSGVVTVSQKLDYDTKKVYQIEIIALDSGTPSLTGTTTLMVNIENSNDKPPSFVPPTQRAEVPEDSSIGTVFTTLIATDPDSLNQDTLRYSISEPITAIDKNGQPVSNETIGYKNFFAVDPKSGQISVVQRLDREWAATVSLNTIVTDTSAPVLQTGTGTLIITIIDVNHQPPEFLKPWTKENPIYSIEMQEEQPIGSIVGAFTATDNDSNISGYNIEPPSSYFFIDNTTGIVRTSQIIDYEETKQLEFTVIAYDSGYPSLSSSARVTVNVININDQDPKFDEDIYKVSIKENSLAGSYVTMVHATDSDDGIFGKINYSIVGEHASDFNIDQKSGNITVGIATVLDREDTPEITIAVMATDNAPINSQQRSTTVSVIITLLDVNDNKPIFTQHSYRATVAENLSVNPPAFILQVRAEDSDDKINGEISYKIISGNEDGSFVLNHQNGFLHPAISLIGRAGNYRIEVEARDGAGMGEHFDRAFVDIRVIAVNQHKPQFIMPELSNATVEVPENTGIPNYLVMTVKAMDNDPGENGKVSYHLKVGNRNVQENEEFSIDQDTGELRAKIILDREIKNKFELVLVASDHGSPTSFETLRLLTIILVDTNDNTPEFLNEYVFRIMENRPKDLAIGQVVAEDKDEGKHAQVYYYIELGNQDESFYIDKKDGTIYSNKSFDRELRDTYILTILAANDPDIYINFKDPKKSIETVNLEQSRVNITILILDENDCLPIFERDYYYAGINSMANINDFVAKVSASDDDLGNNGTLQYYVASSNLYKYESKKSSGSIVPSPFNITQDGKLVTSGYMAEYNQNRFIVEIIAKEIVAPERYAKTLVHIWVFEPSQLIRVILSRPPGEVNRQRDEIILELSNATKSRIIVDDIRYHVDSSGHINREWSDMYLHAVDLKSQIIIPVLQILEAIDAKYDVLKDYYSGFAIQNVLPAYAGVQKEFFDPALAALIALLVVLLIGAITVTAVCCCLRHWIITIPNDIRKKDGLIKKQIIDELNTTENPLWIEQKLKLYEEQELTMQVFSEPDTGVNNQRRGSSGDMSVGMGDTSHDNTYATIQHPVQGTRHRSTTPDYTTLPRNHNLYESTIGFQSSVFQSSTTPAVPQLTLDRDGQPQFVSGLI